MNNGTIPACASGLNAATLSAWRDSALSAAEAERVRVHVARCAACQERLAEYEAIARIVRGQHLSEPDERLWRGVRADMASQRAGRRGFPLAFNTSGAWRSLAAVAAVLLLVVGFAKVLQLGSLHRVVTTSTPSATLRPASSWSTITFNGTSAGYLEPAVAPSDARVIYLGATDQHGPVVLRSTNDGKTWQTLRVPTTDLAADPNAKGDTFEATPSPTDANTVLVTLTSFLSNSRCPRVSNPTGGVVSDPACFFQYLSHDGGRTWTSVTLPSPNAVIGLIPLTSALLRTPSSGTLIAQRGRLYAALSPNPDTTSTAGWRLVSSSDGGSTWAYADQALVAHRVNLTSYLPDATGAGAWVLAVPASSTPGQGPVQLWRTNDGTRWYQAKLPQDCSQNCTLVGATTLASGGSRLVVSDQQTPFEVTTDNGAHWQVIPTTGVPSTIESGLEAGASAGSAGVLSDGTILAMFVAPSPPDAGGDASQSGYYAWSPGAHSWQRVTLASPSYPPYMSWLTMRPDGSYTIWVLGAATGGKLLVASADLG
jgi:hypothetical protein